MGCFFRVKDVSMGFEMVSLQDNLVNAKTQYEHGEDYKYFYCKRPDQVRKDVITREPFLTYTGILKVLFISRSGKAKEFIKWATKTLFTVQMGTKQQKRQLASHILGVPAHSVKEVFKTSVRSLPCVYLFSLGDVKSLRRSMGIDTKYPDNAIVCKYGYTVDLSRRTTEHIKTFECCWE